MDSPYTVMISPQFFQSQEKLYVDGLEYRNQFGYMNHSCKPNAMLSNSLILKTSFPQLPFLPSVSVIALRQLKELEEVVIDYNWSTRIVELAQWFEDHMPCLCSERERLGPHGLLKLERQSGRK